MLSIKGPEEVIKNIITISKPYLIAPINQNTLRNAYRTFLKNAQPEVPQGNSPEISFLWEKQDIKNLLKIFEEESVLDDFDEVFSGTNANDGFHSIKLIKDALEQMKNLNSNYSNIINLAIHTIFAAPSQLAGGGSTSAAIGCIWVDARKHWATHDILEFLVHETTHNLIFINELCNQHYNDYDEIVKKENFSWSAILNKPRPMDKVFHSILVSTEVLLFRNSYIGHPENSCLHPPSHIMLEQTQNSINYIKKSDALSGLLTDIAKELLETCEENLHKIAEKSFVCTT